MLVAGEPPEGRVHGVLFEIAAAERAALDGFEGVGYGYRREDAFPVQRTDTGESVAAAVYLAESGHVDATLQPYEWYRALVLAGAHQHRLPPAWIARLEGCAFRVDPDPDRPSRCEALALLAGVGFAHLLPGGLPG
jgi:MYXO-CTERM domain-containing protein